MKRRDFLKYAGLAPLLPVLGGAVAAESVKYFVFTEINLEDFDDPYIPPVEVRVFSKPEIARLFDIPIY